MAWGEGIRADWLSYEEALARILESASSLAESWPTERLPLRRALGRAVAESVRARATLPSWPNSAMDGFALQSADLRSRGPEGLRFPVAGRSYPGEAPLRGLRGGVAVRVMTGAPVPEGFDTVIRVEHTDGEAEEGHVVVLRTEDIGRHVRGAGRDLRAGEEAVAAGTAVDSGAIAVLLASGRESVAVHRQPRVGVLSSGDELVGTDRFDEVEKGLAVPDTNRGMLAGAAFEHGAVAQDLGVASDDASDIRARIADLADIDVLVTTGGASMGERDLLKSVLLAVGLRLSFWRVRVRPGSPVSFGHLPVGNRRVPVFGLPGNPASAFVTFHTLVAPYLRTLGGHLRPRGTLVRCRTGDPLSSPPRITHFYRVALSPPGADQRGGRAGPASADCWLTGPQGSDLVSSLMGADGLAMVGEGVGRVEAGDTLPVLLLPGRC